MDRIRYIDLFAGVGGFHLAMKDFGGKCVFASEIDSAAIETYKMNFGIDSEKDITDVKPEELPPYDMMCAGFPCQAFSKAGHQKGFEETRGTLFFDMVRLLKYRVESADPVKYILFENVRNLITHDNHNTYRVIINTLKDLGYIVNDEPIIASPHFIGIPQLRERAFILGVHEKFAESHIDLNIEFKHRRNITNAYDIIDKHRVKDKYYITEYEKKVLTAWDEFYKGIKEEVIGFPIWAEYFSKYRVEKNMPKWKKDFIDRNKKLYLNNKQFIDKWLKRWDNLDDFIKTHRKFEWQCGNHCKSIWEGIIQFRPSGIRVKRPTEFPALVAMVHIPIIGKYKRRLTVKEVAKLQSFPDDFIINQDEKQALKQFGNSVNVEVIKTLIRKLLSFE